MRGTETRKFSVIEETDDRLVLSSRPFLLRIAVPVFLSPFLLILVFLLIARLDSGPPPMGGYVEVRYSQGRFPGRPVQIAVLSLSELGDLLIRRETFKFVRHGPVPTSFIFTSDAHANFVLPTRDQDDEAAAFLKWIEAAKRRARNSAAE